MANFTIELDKYSGMMKALIGRITALDGQKRVVNADSSATHDVTLSFDGGLADGKVTLVLKESNLYILGFKNSAGTEYRFKDFPMSGAQTLAIGSHYTKANCISILRDESASIATSQRSRQSIEQAIRVLASYQGGSVLDTEKAAFGMMTFVLSESIRFKTLYQKMCRVMNDGETFSFGSFKPYVCYWEDLSAGGAVAGAVGNSISTYHR